ncbi:ATP-binding cassette domain-containing protein [Candidatus Woesearchaeota archaeon]|nr:ATP-binding cassette domain-containing protein [Candidatus Woesearchaeota archaeon]
MGLDFFVIRLYSLCKRFGTMLAVDNVSFQLAQGEIFGLLGPNGAGKTTLLGMLSTMVKPSSGRAYVHGYDICRHEHHVRRQLGVVFQDMSLDDDLTAEENLDFHGRLYGMGRTQRQQQVRELLALVDLVEKRTYMVRTFSGGMKRRLELARALMHKPAVLFLDEPTVGLDPQTRLTLWQYLRHLNEKYRVTIILTTHYLDEADSLCHRIGIIDKGKIVALDTPRLLKERMGATVVTVEGLRAPQLLAIAGKWGTVMDNTVALRGENVVMPLLKAATRLGVTNISISKPSLERVFLHFTGCHLRDADADARDAMRITRQVYRR